MRKFVIMLVILALTGSILAIEQIPRNKALYIAGHQWGPPENWNPFTGNPTWPVDSPQPLIYETLFMINILTGELEPLLAEKYEIIDDLTIKVTLHDGIHWQDGKPLTADDVVYTYEVAKKYPVSYSTVWQYLEKVYAKDERTIVFKMKADNPNRLILLDTFWNVYIVPKHIWSKVEEEAGYEITKIREFKNDKPVGSGPYQLYYYSPDRVVLKRYDNYWGVKLFGKLPAPEYIVHPVFKSNDEGNLAFEKGEIDLSQQFCPQIWEMWEKKGLPVSTWYKKPPYHVPAAIPSIWFNVHKYPLSIPEVRKAIAYCIDYARIAELAMTRYSPVAQSSLILPYGGEAKFFNEELVKKYGWEYNPEKAVEILENLGCEKGPDGIYRLPDGTRLGPFKAECPYGWTDWMVSLQIVSECAREIGIDIRPYFPDTPVAYDDRMTGNFDIVMWTPAGYPGPSQPWSRFQEALYSKDVPPIGEIAFKNFGRYSNPKVDELIEKIPKVTDEEELKKLYWELDKIFMEDVPLIPLEYRPWLFYEYNETYWKGFPNAENPYAPPSVLAGAGVKILYHIEPTGK